MNNSPISIRFSTRTVALAVALACSAQVCLAADTNSTINWAGYPCEISVSQVSDKTVQVLIDPIETNGTLRPIPTTAAFIPFPTTELYRSRDLTGSKTIDAGKMKVTIKTEPLTISVFRADGSLVQELTQDNPTNGTMSFHMDAPVFGMGEGEQQYASTSVEGEVPHQFDRRGWQYAMVNGQLSPMLATHGATIPVPFLIGSDGWSMFIRAPWGRFDLRNKLGLFQPQRQVAGRGRGTNAPPQAQQAPPLAPFIVYISELDEPADALAEFIRMTGHPVMPAKWVMGYMQSHRTLLGPDDALQIAQKFRDEKLPCDAVIYLGTGYCPLGWNIGHGTLEFNTNSFPHPAEEIKALHDLNLKIVLHINNAPRNLFGTSVNEQNDSPLYIGNYWKRHIPDMNLGVDAWWPDDGDELPIEARLARHLCYYEGPLMTRPNVRPWSLNRNAYAGAARYGGWIWSGDTASRWATLAAHVPVAINSSLSLTPFWGSDTGGFNPTRELTGELYTRWFEFSTFNPLFRSHGRTWHLRLPWGWDTGETGPVEETRDSIDHSELHNTNVEPICRTYLDLRYELLPYNYTLMRESVDAGLPAMRALWLHYPKDPVAVKQGDEYLWGRDMLVAPVVEKGATNRHLYLPVGTWNDWWTGKPVQGGAWVDRPVDLATMPIYVRAGAIIPLDPLRQYTAQPVSGPTTLRVYPGADGSYTLYDDDGTSLDYQNGSDAKTEWIHITWDDKSKQLTVEPDARMKKWPGGVKDFAVEVVGSSAAPQVVHFSGKTATVKL